MPVILRRSRWTTKPKIRDPELDFAHPLSAGLVGAWILGLAPASAMLRDLSGNGNHGTLLGSSISRVNYRGGRALFFNGDGNTDRYDLGPIDSANPLCLTGDVLTFVAGFRLQQSGLGNTFPRVFDKSDGAGLVNGYGFYIDDGVGDDYRFDVNGTSYGSDTLTGNEKYRYHIACVTQDGSTLTFFKEVGDQTNFGQVGGTNAIPSATTNAAIGNWNHTTDRNWHGYIDFVYLWDRVLDLGARRAIQNNPYQFVQPRLSGRTYVAYGITAQPPPRGDTGKGSIVIAIAP